MILYEVTVNGEQTTRTGAPDQSSMSLRLTSADVFPAPNLSVSAFKVEGEKLKKHYQWDFPNIEVGDEVTIRVLSEGDPDQPTRVDDSRPLHTPDERAMMKYEIVKLKRLNADREKALERSSSAGGSDDDSQVTLYCSFCGLSQHEVKKLIAGPAVFICNECVDACVEIQKDES